MAKLAGAIPEVAYRAEVSVHDDVPYRLLAPGPAPGMSTFSL
jgi:hypothetical protein